MRKFGKNKKWQTRGLTLIELMIVVAIIGILAAVGGTAFFRSVKNGKIAKLEQYAMDLARGEEEFRSRQGRYYPLTANTVETYDLATTAPRWRNLLGFSQVVPNDIILRVESGPMGTTPATPECSQAGVNTTTAWFCVIVIQDLDPNNMLNSTIIMYQNAPSPVRLNEYL